MHYACHQSCQSCNAGHTCGTHASRPGAYHVERCTCRTAVAWASIQPLSGMQANTTGGIMRIVQVALHCSCNFHSWMGVACVLPWNLLVVQGLRLHEYSSVFWVMVSSVFHECCVKTPTDGWFRIVVSEHSCHVWQLSYSTNGMHLQHDHLLGQ